MIFEGLSFVWRSSSPGANLEAYKLFKLYSITLSPAAVPAWSDPAQHHTRVLIVFAVSPAAELEASAVWEKWVTGVPDFAMLLIDS